MISKVVLLSISLFLISCIEIRDPDKETKEPAVMQPIAEVSPLSQPQSYAVMIKGLQGMSQITRKTINSLRLADVASVPVLKEQAEDIIDQPGVYEYSVQQAGKTFQLQVEIPQDYVVEGDMKLEQLETNLKREEDHFRILETKGRVYFKAGSSLTTNGENFLIKAGMIESEGALVRTFPPGQTARVGVPGRHGGHIMFEANSIRGTLQVDLRGENGGMGEGSTFMTRKRLEQLDNNGQKGGNSGLLELDINDQSKGDVTFNLEPGHGGQGVVIVMFSHIYKGKGQDGMNGVAQQPIGIK